MISMIDVTSVIRGFRAELSAKFVYYSTNGATIIFLSRQLPPDRYGRLFLVISILGVFRLFSSLGIAKSAARYVSSYLDSDPPQVPHIVRTSFEYTLVTITAVSVVLVTFAGAIAGVFDDPSLETLLVAGASYIVFATLYNYSRVLLQGLSRVTESATVYASEGVGRLLFVVVFVVAGFGTLGALVGYVMGFVLAAGIGLALLYLDSRRRVGADRMESGLRGDVLRYSAPLAVTRGAWVLNRDVDVVIVGLFLNPATVGFYAISKQVMTFCTGPASSIGFAVGPQYSEEAVADDRGQAARVYEAMLVSGLLLYAPAVVGLIALTDPLVTTVFGTDYRGAVPILQVFALGIVLFAITEMTEDILDYLGRATARAKLKGLTSIGNVVFTVAFLQILGAIGAALATVVMQAIYAGFCLYLVDSEISLRRTHLRERLGRIGAITVFVGITVVALSGFVSGIVTLGASILGGAAVWAVLAIASGMVDVRDLSDVLTSGNRSD